MSRSKARPRSTASALDGMDATEFIRKWEQTQRQRAAARTARGSSRATKPRAKAKATSKANPKSSSQKKAGVTLRPHQVRPHQVHQTYDSPECTKPQVCTLQQATVAVAVRAAKSNGGVTSALAAATAPSLLQTTMVHGTQPTVREDSLTRAQPTLEQQLTLPQGMRRLLYQVRPLRLHRSFILRISRNHVSLRNTGLRKRG